MDLEITLKEALKKAIATVFTNSLSINHEIKEVGVLSADSEPKLLASIGLSGQLGASLTMVGTETSACKLVSKMLSCDIPKVSQDVVDGMGEIANMLAGCMKTTLDGADLHFSLSIPSVIVDVDSAKIAELKSTKFIKQFIDGKDFCFIINFSYAADAGPDHGLKGKAVPESQGSDAANALKNILGQ